MSNQTGEINFSQIFKVVKKSFIRALIYVLISVVVVSSALFCVRTFTTTTTTQASVYISKKGSSPQEVRYNKAIAVTNALKALNYDDTDEKLSDTILENLAFNAIVPSNLANNASFVPTSYTLELDSNGLSALSEAQKIELVDEIAKQLLNSFSMAELPNFRVSNTLESDLKVLEYYQIADELALYVENALSLISSQINSYPNANNYVDPVSGKSLSDVQSSMDIIIKRIDNLKTYIITNRLENNDNLKIVLETMKNQAFTKEQAYKEQAEKALEVLNKFPSYNSGSNNEIKVDLTPYGELAKEYNNILALQAEASRAVKLYDEYLTTISSITPVVTDPTYIAKQTYTEDVIHTLYNDLNAELNTYTALAKEYNENSFLVTEAKIISPARSFKNNNLRLSAILYADIAVAVVAYLIAYFQVYFKLKKINATNESDQPTEQPTNA